MRAPSISVLLCVGLITGCGAKDDGEGTHSGDTDPVTTTPTTPTTAPTTPPTTSSCEPTGTVTGCLVDGVIDCTGNAAYDSSPGGWFDDSVRDLMTITTAPNADKLAITFEIYSPDILGGAIFDVPINAMATVTDTTDASNTQFIKSCFGRLQLTAYEENVSLSGTWQFQAEAGTGPCEEIEEFSYSEAVFTDLAFCP